MDRLYQIKSDYIAEKAVQVLKRIKQHQTFLMMLEKNGTPI